MASPVLYDCPASRDRWWIRAKLPDWTAFKDCIVHSVNLDGIALPSYKYRVDEGYLFTFVFYAKDDHKVEVLMSAYG